MTTTPRSPSPVQGVNGASRVSGIIDNGRQRWNWLQRLHVWRTFSHFTNAGGSVLSAGMSYQALFAVFAGLWVGFSVFGIVLTGRPELLETLVAQLDMLVPGLVGENGVVPVDTLLQTRVLSWSSAAAGASLLWVAISWFTGTRRAIRIIFGLEVKQYKNAVLLKLRDFILAISFSLAIVASAALTLMSSNVMHLIYEWLGADQQSWLLGGLGTVTRYAAMYVFDVLLLIAMHRFLAELHIPRWRLIFGCALGGIVLLGIKLLGSFLLGGATNNPLLATFAVFIGLLLWFNFICRTLLLTASWIATGLDPSRGLPFQAEPVSPSEPA